MSGLLLICLTFYLSMSITVFKADKTQLVFDLNKSQVSNLASEINVRLKSISESLSLFARLPEKEKKELLSRLFKEDSEVVALFSIDQKRIALENKFLKSEYFETYDIDQSLFEQKALQQRKQFEKINLQGEHIWNASFSGFPPMIAVGRRVLVLDESNEPIEQKIIISYLKIDSFIKSISLLSISSIFISNSEGEILVEKDISRLGENPSIAESDLFKKALDSEVKTSVTHIEEKGQGWLSAFSKTYGGKIIVLAQAPEEKVFQVVKSLTFRTLLFGSIVLTLVILAAFLLSKTLTENVALLAKRMKEASVGDLESPIILKGRDETVSLGNSFNKMIADLKRSRDDLEIMNKELDKKVKERTHELEIQNQKVAEAQEALLRTARLASMGEVAGRTAHEVLNPLTSLLTRVGLVEKKVNDKYVEPIDLLSDIEDAWAEDFKEGGLEQLVTNWKKPSDINPKQNLFLEDFENLNEIRNSLERQIKEISQDMIFIKKEGDRIGKIIHGMRRLSNTNSVSKEENLHELLEDCCYIMADLYDQQRFKIEKDFVEGLIMVKVDRDEFIQAVTNLMRNSLQSLNDARLQSAETSTYWVKLRTVIVDNIVKVQIVDNGSGIDNKYQSQLFTTNFTTKSTDEGTGLGLSISRRFLRSQNGDIVFKSSVPFKETIFEIQLPILDSIERKDVA